jgi:peptidoglycan/xylan/chitin deacetylase (PgdA/CDA1 family)
MIMLHDIGENPGIYTISGQRFLSLAKPNIRRLSFDDGYLSVADSLLEVFGRQKCSLKVILFLVVGKIGQANDWDKEGEFVGKALLTWEQARQLKLHGVEFGSHSLTHPDLTKLTQKALELEINESKRILEEELEMVISTFAYPFGLWNQRVIDTVKKAGYQWAVTASGRVWEGIGNPYRQRRIEIRGIDPDWVVRLKMSFLYDTKGIWELPTLLLEKYALMRRR